MIPWKNPKRWILLGGVLGFVGLLALPPFPGLSVEGQRTLGVFLLATSLWITGRPVPPAVTGLLILGLIPFLRIRPPEETFSLFGNRAVFFILGAFILAAALMKTGLAQRLSLWLLKQFRGSRFRLLAGIFLTADFLSWWMPEHAAAALLFPILVRITRRLALPRSLREYEGLLFLSMAWGCVIGGIATPLGGARAPLAMGLLQEEFGIRLQFLQWTLAAAPVALALTLGGLLLLWLHTRPLQEVEHHLRALDFETNDPSWEGLKPEEKRTLGIYLLALVGWIFLNPWLDMAVVAILAGTVLFVTGTLTWRDVETHINWGVILMYGGAIALGKTLVETGAAEWLVTRTLLPLAQSPASAVVLLILLTMILTEVISNVATVALLLPIVFGLVEPLRLSPVLSTYVVAIPAGLALLLPMGAPPNAIAYSSGTYTVGEAIKRGGLLPPWAFLVLLAAAFWLWP